MQHETVTSMLAPITWQRPRRRAVAGGCGNNKSGGSKRNGTRGKGRLFQQNRNDMNGNGTEALVGRIRCDNGNFVACHIGLPVQVGRRLLRCTTTAGKQHCMCVGMCNRQDKMHAPLCEQASYAGHNQRKLAHPTTHGVMAQPNCIAARSGVARKQR